MTIEEETDEYLFVQHVVDILGVENSRPDLEPGGLWICRKFRLSWGLRHATEPPTLQVGLSSAILNGPNAFLPYELEGRLAQWRTVWDNRATSIHKDLTSLDFRDIVAITAILGWRKESDQTL
jgi:hypothetical protein